MTDQRLWCHLAPGALAGPVTVLLARILEDLPRLHVSVSAEPGVDVPARLVDMAETLNRETDLAPAQTAEFHAGRPRVALISGELAGSGIFLRLREAGTRLFLLGGAPVGRDPRAGRFWSRIAGSFSRRGGPDLELAIATGPGDMSYFRKMDIDPARIQTVPELAAGSATLPCNAKELDAFTELFGARPVWLASGVPMAEVEHLHLAHRTALRASHRLLLIVRPLKDADGPALAAAFRERGWATALRSDGEDPGNETQILVADTTGEDGLWYRLSPITFVGNSLAPDGIGGNPWDPATLGSAVLHGPRMSCHPAETIMLGNGGCLRQVTDGSDLGAAVSAYLSPDVAARMANRAWEIVSSGSDAADRIAVRIRDCLTGEAA